VYKHAQSRNLYLVFKDGVWISIKEHLIDRHVERRNHFLWVCYQLTAQIRVKLTQVLTVEVEEWLTNDTYLRTHIIIYAQHRLTNETILI